MELELQKILQNPNIKKSSLSLIFGKKVFKDCFDFNFTEKNYLEFLRFIKNHEKWNMISKKNIKTFYFYDLKLIAEENGELTLEKNIITQFNDFLDDNNQGFRLITYNNISDMDINIFPGLDKINDIRKIREIIFQKEDIFVKFMVVSHTNKDITFEIFIESTNHKQLFSEIPKFLQFFDLKNITKCSEICVKNTDNLSISII